MYWVVHLLRNDDKVELDHRADDSRYIAFEPTYLLSRPIGSSSVENIPLSSQ